MTTNISKEKRDSLVAKINEIKKFIQSSPQDKNTASLLTYISEIEKDIKGKKYGLVFEEHRETIDEILENNVPILKEDESLFIDNGGQMNFLIEGDNLASLKLLEKTHKGKIDLIYIDPPYNTGNKDFIYDDKFVDDKDLFQHSKWLSFMKQRLVIAKNLLSDNASIFISIDDNEQAALKLLCDEIFGINNFINQIVLKTKASAGASGGGEDKRLKKNTEYMLWYVRNKIELFFEKPKNKIKLSDYIKEHKENRVGFYYTRIITNYGKKEFVGNIKLGNGDDIKIYKHNGFEFSSVSKLSNELNCSEDEIYKKYYNDIFMVTNAQTSILPKVNKFIGEKNCLVSYEYIPTTGKSKGQLETKLVWNETLVVWLKDSTILVDGEIYKTEILGTLWENISWGRLDLEGYVSFKNGKKPLSLLNQIMEFTIKKNSTILDFFAGSGTTGHAVMKLNAEDGGNRKFILCTNNENNICRDVTYERIKRVIKKENYKSSLKYMKVDFVPISDKFYYEYADELLKNVKELVELENGINFKGNKEIAIILTEEELDTFTKDIPAECKNIYLGHNILPTDEQEKLFKDKEIKINIIPDYYYRELED